MQRVVGFYSKLPRGAAPEPEAKGVLGWYRKKYFGKNSSGARRASPNSVGQSQEHSANPNPLVSSPAPVDVLRCHRLRPELLLPLA